MRSITNPAELQREFPVETREDCIRSWTKYCEMKNGLCTLSQHAIEQRICGRWQAFGEGGSPPLPAGVEEKLAVTMAEQLQKVMMAGDLGKGDMEKLVASTLEKVIAHPGGQIAKVQAELAALNKRLDAELTRCGLAKPERNRVQG
jgi:hypothetical protein